MSVLTREDDIQFVTQSYREILLTKNAMALKAELRGLAQTNGRYARLFKQNNGQTEAVYSSDSGYLLGETVWIHFNKPYNLLYCEALDNDKYIIVIVKNRMIHLDAVLDSSALIDEISTLGTDKIQFDIKLVGDVPIAQSSEDDSKLILQADLIKSFTELDTAVFPVLPLLPQYQLLDIDQAIQVAKIGKIPPLIALAVFTLIVATIWVLWPQARAPKVEQAQISPEQRFQNALATPSPADQIDEMTQTIMHSMTVPGWQLVTANRKNNTLKVTLRSIAGTTHDLIEWANLRGYKVNLTSNGAELSKRSQLVSRQAATTITPSLYTLSEVIDRMMMVIPSKSVDIGSVKHHQLFQSTKLSIHFTQLSTDSIAIVARELSGLPLTLQVTNINVKNGLLTGTIKLTVIGN